MAIDIVILAAGQGTRMKSDVPKVLHSVAGRPMVAEVVATAREVGGQRIVVVVGHGAEQVRPVAGEGVDFALQPDQLGTAHAVMQAAPLLASSRADTVLVLYGDSPLITAPTLRRALTAHAEAGATVTLLSFMPEDATGYGRIVRAEDGQVVAIVEEREATAEQKRIRESNSGFMVFERAWLWENLSRLKPAPRGEYYLTDMTALCVAEGRRVEAIQVDEREVLGVNDRAQLGKASALLWQRRREKWMRAGVTMVDPATVWIEAGVTIGVDTTLHPNVYLRGTTTVGAGCTIGAFSLLENAKMAEGTTLPPFTHLPG